MSKAEDSRNRVLGALRASDKPLTETDIHFTAKVSGMWLSHALVGLLHQGLVRYVGRNYPGTDRRSRYFWEAVRGADAQVAPRPSPSYTDVGRDGHD